MPLQLQKITITRIFNKFNPDVEPDNLDWDNLDDKSCFSENYDNMANAHLDYVWEDPQITLERMEEEQKNWQIEQMQNEAERLRSAGLVSEAEAIEKEIDKIMSEEKFTKIFKHKSQIVKTENGTEYSIIVEIKPHNPKSKKGIVYKYGRIQILLPRDLVGLEAKIIILKPSELQIETKKDGETKQETKQESHALSEEDRERFLDESY